MCLTRVLAEACTRMPLRSDNLRHRVEIELIRSLFATVAPSIIMSVGFVACSFLIWWELRSHAVLALAITGTLGSIGRLTVLLRSCREARSARLELDRARLLERRFAISYIAFAGSLGLFGAVVLWGSALGPHALTVCLLVGYAAGVAAGTGLRPRIAVPSMLVAIIPAAGASALSSEPTALATGAMLVLFLGGGIHSLLERFRRTRNEVGERITFAGMARQDSLTALPNRLALREWFENVAPSARGGAMMALHYLDLDGFKPVNDRFGHPTGDELLRAVASRLAGGLKREDIVARLGGDEFVVVQHRIAHAGEAELLAQRLCREVRTPFRIGDHEISVSTCVGYVTSDCGSDDLEQLLAHADEALYAAKRGSEGVVRWKGEAEGGPDQMAA